MGTEYYAVCNSHFEIFQLGKYGTEWSDEDKMAVTDWVIKRNFCITYVHDAVGDMIPYHEYTLVGTVYSHRKHCIGKPFHRMK